MDRLLTKPELGSWIKKNFENSPDDTEIKIIRNLLKNFCDENENPLPEPELETKLAKEFPLFSQLPGSFFDRAFFAIQPTILEQVASIDKKLPQLQEQDVELFKAGLRGRTRLNELFKRENCLEFSDWLKKALGIILKETPVFILDAQLDLVKRESYEIFSYYNTNLILETSKSCSKSLEELKETLNNFDEEEKARVKILIEGLQRTIKDLQELLLGEESRREKFQVLQLFLLSLKTAPCFFRLQPENKQLPIDKILEPLLKRLEGNVE